MQRYEKCEVDDPFLLSELFFDSSLTFLCSMFRKILLKPGSTLNPDDGRKRNDVNFECKTLAARKSVCMLHTSTMCFLTFLRTFNYALSSSQT